MSLLTLVTAAALVAAPAAPRKPARPAPDAPTAPKLLGEQLPMPPPPAAAAAAPKAPALSVRRVAVMDVTVVGEVPERPLAVLRQAVAPELRKLEGLSVITSGELQEMLSLERQRQLLGCEEESACMAEIANALDAHDLVAMELTLVGGTYALTARRTDMRQARVVQTYTKRFERRDGEEVLAQVGPLVEGLFPERALKPGKRRGLEAEVVRRLNPPPLPRWAFFTTAGAAAGAALGGATFGLLAREAEGDLASLAAQAVQEPVPGSTLRDLQDKAGARAGHANRLFLAAGVLGVAAGVQALFTDWHDDRGALDTRVQAGPAVALGAGGGGAGLLVSGRF